MFFLFMSFASFSTLTAVFENLISNCIDNFGISRRRATLINCIIVLIGSVPCVLGFNLLSGVNLLGMNILDMEDFVVSNLLLPGGSIVYLFFCTYKFGWGFDNFIAEANTGRGIKLRRGLVNYFKFVLPVLMLFVFIMGLIPR